MPFQNFLFQKLLARMRICLHRNALARLSMNILASYFPPHIVHHNTSNIRFFISSTMAQTLVQERPKDKRMNNENIHIWLKKDQKPKKIKDKNTHIGPPLNEDLGNLLSSTSNRIVKRGRIPETQYLEVNRNNPSIQLILKSLQKISFCVNEGKHLQILIFLPD